MTILGDYNVVMTAFMSHITYLISDHLSVVIFEKLLKGSKWKNKVITLNHRRHQKLVDQYRMSVSQDSVRLHSEINELILSQP